MMVTISAGYEIKQGEGERVNNSGAESKTYICFSGLTSWHSVLNYIYIFFTKICLQYIKYKRAAPTNNHYT